MNLGDIQKMLGQVKQVQEQMQEKLEKLSVEASAGGGMVTVKMNGRKQVLEVKIDPEVLSGGDREMLQDLVLAAVNEASRQVDAEVQQQMASLTGGLNLPRIPGLF
jgi:DNA-binding YbaB/EbfC family protein